MRPGEDRAVALVPMRHHSVRVPGKNLRHLGGMPLYHRIVRALRACDFISEIVVDTDSPDIKDDLARCFPEVRVLDRPEHLRGDAMPMTEVLAHDAAQVPAAVYLQTHSTNPFLSPETLQRAWQTWQAERAAYDSLFGVTRIQARLWDGTARPMNHNPWVLLRTQDLPPLFLENSTFYVFPGDLIRSTRRRIGDRPRLFEVDPIEAIDLDEERDFALAELILRARAEERL